ncbi:hypothetical protein CU098_009008 [Rhizopus stolonifer]|uniref:Uncharacterized protein n=1 Tax=Rhizopus stolonifer TaxID=4846 RepID=A0A367JPH9_RHIST|nr:hypothetical protein CU098_009008 [Rhizopus stolonifer]
MSTRTLSLFIPGQKSKRPASVSSSSSSTKSYSWSLDQLSLYTNRRASTQSSLSQGQDEKKKRRQAERLKQVSNRFNHILLLSLNDCSLGFYKIFDHIQRKIPKIVETKKKLQKSSEKVAIAILDIKDVRKNVCDIEQIDSFYNISKMIEQSLDIIQSKQ